MGQSVIHSLGFAFPQFCQSLNILGDSVQIDQFSLTLSIPTFVKHILIPQNYFGMQTNLTNKQT